MSEKIQILSNTNYSLVDVLKSELIESTQVKMAIAFVRRTGIDEIYKSLEYAMNVNSVFRVYLSSVDDRWFVYWVSEFECFRVLG